MKRIREDETVYDVSSDRKGTVLRLYPEINLAVVDFNGSTEKARLEDLVVMVDEPTAEDTKKETLLEKIKGRFRK